MIRKLDLIEHNSTLTGTHQLRRQQLKEVRVNLGSENSRSRKDVPVLVTTALLVVKAAEVVTVEEVEEERKIRMKDRG